MNGVYAEPQLPTSRPTAPKPTTVPSQKNAPQTKRVQVVLNEKGQLLVDGVQNTLVQWAALVTHWKKQAVDVYVRMHPSAPSTRVLILKEFLRESKLKWKAVVPVPKPKHAQKTKALPAFNWSKVPMGQVRGSQGKPGMIELRGRVLQSRGVAKRFAPLGFVIYKKEQQGREKRSVVGFLRSDRNGFFRFRFAPEKRAAYHISLLDNRSVIEFSVPHQRQAKGLLYVRFMLKGANQGRPVIQRRIKAVRTKPQKVHKTALPKRHPAVPVHRTQPAKRASAVVRCNWSNAPKIQVPSKKQGAKVALRIRIFMQKNTPASITATGLIRREGKKTIPVARGKTDKQGCIVYLIDADRSTYNVAILHGTGLQMAPTPAIHTARKGVLSMVVTLKSSARKSSMFGSLHTFFESRTADWLQVTHVASLFYAPQAGKKEPVSFLLPVSQKAVRLQFGRELSRLRPKVTKRGVLLQRLKPGENRFLYGYLLPRNNDGEAHVSLPFAHKVNQVVTFFARGQLLPSKGRKKMKPITRGSGKNIRKFWMMKFPPSKPQTALELTVVPKNPPPSGWVGWVSRMKRKGKKNKLLGLGVLVVFSCLGLFWLISAPRKNTPS